MVTFDDNLLAHVESPWRPEWAWDWGGWEYDPVPIEEYTQADEQPERWTPEFRKRLTVEALRIING
jgi:hypothetical protein